MMNPQAVVDIPCKTGEGPLWHPDERCLYWVDIPNGLLFRYEPAADQTERFELGAPVGGFTLQTDGTLLLFMARGAVRAWRGGRFVGTVFDEIATERETRFNDVIADPAGRVFCGTMSSAGRPGRLYRLDPDRRLTVIQDEVGTSNGMGFTPDRRGFYHTDTRRHEIYRYDYVAATGAVANRRVFVHIDAGEARPDGMTVDAAGCVWTACWAGGCILRFADTGALLTRLEFPVRNVTSLTFGGDDGSDLYVTTAGGDDRAANGPLAGALFRLRLPGMRGVPEFRSRIGVPAVD